MYKKGCSKRIPFLSESLVSRVSSVKLEPFSTRPKKLTIIKENSTIFGYSTKFLTSGVLYVQSSCDFGYTSFAYQSLLSVLVRTGYITKEEKCEEEKEVEKKEKEQKLEYTKQQFCNLLKEPTLLEQVKEMLDQLPELLTSERKKDRDFAEVCLLLRGEREID